MQTVVLIPCGLLWLIGGFSRRKTARISRCERLARRKVITVPAREDQRIRCVEGVVWITDLESRGDVILRKGTKVLGSRKGIVIEALEDSIIEITSV